MGIGNHSQMFYFLVYARPICIQLVNNLELFVPLAKICVNENDLCEWKYSSFFFMCMYSHETAEVTNQYVYYTSSEEAENLVEVT